LIIEYETIEASMFRHFEESQPCFKYHIRPENLGHGKILLPSDSSRACPIILNFKNVMLIKAFQLEVTEQEPVGRQYFRGK
jgi:hypothetical protein